MNNAIAKKYGPLTQSLVFFAAYAISYTASAKSKLDLSDLVNIGLNRSPIIKRQTHIWQSSIEKRKEVRGTLFPEITAKGNVTDRDYVSGNSSSSSPDYTTYLEASQPLYRGGALTGGLKYYRTAEKIAKLELEKIKLQVLYDLISTYYHFAESTQLHRAAEINEDILEKHVTVIQRYERIGRSRQTDKLQSELNWLNAKSQTKSIESNTRQYAERLRVLLALVETPEIELPPDLSTQSEITADADKVIFEALKNNPSVQISELAEFNVQNEKKIELSQDLPQVKVVGQVGYRSDNLDHHFENDQQYSSVTLSLEVPLFSGGSSFAKRRRFQQSELSAARDNEISKLNIDGDVRTAISILKTSQQQLDVAVVAKKKAQIALDIAARDYQKGLITSSDLINIQRSKFESDNLYIRSQYEYRRADLTLSWLKGQDLVKIYSQAKAIK